MKVIAAALALGLAPDVVVQPSAWASENLVVADGPRAGQKWSADLTPYVSEILDCLAADSPHTRVSVRKSAQTGLTEAGIAWVASIIANNPARVMIVLPTVPGAQDFNKEKLAPTIEATPALRRKVSEARSRSLRASTALSKRFPGGSLTITGANSAADLRSKTVKYVYADEIDEWPLDLDKQGDPMEMVDARQISFHATGDYKKFETSTPTIKGQSRIDDAFELGDQRFWHVKCPQCGFEQRLEFGGKDKRHGLKFNTSFPYGTHYVCKDKGCIIEHHQKREMVIAGRWIATKPEPGRHPSFHIDAISSLLTTWDKLVEKFLEAQGDPQKLKTFTNLWLGEAWEERGEAPPWKDLYDRRLDYTARTIPPGGLIITAAADVQKDGIFYEVVAWGRNRRSWSIDIGFLPGDTGDIRSKAYADLDKVRTHLYTAKDGRGWPVDAMAIDSNYSTNAVRMWARGKPNVYTVQGRPGWYLPPILTPTKQDIDYDGVKISGGSLLWPVGTWPLKGAFYSYLRLTGPEDGAEEFPDGWCEFSSFHDEGYFKQITSEALVDKISRGRKVREWDAFGRANHYLDCRIYNMAMASYCKVELFSDDDWRRVEEVRAPRPDEPGLLSLMAAPVAAKEPPRKEASEPPAQDTVETDWVEQRDDWI